VVACSASASEAKSPRHCTQALPEQPDQLILSNTLPRPAARALFSLRLHSVSLAFRLCAQHQSSATAASIRRDICRGSLALWPRYHRYVHVRESGKSSRDDVVLSTPPPLLQIPHFFALPFVGGVVLAVPCRVPQNYCTSSPRQDRLFIWPPFFRFKGDGGFPLRDPRESQ